MPLFFLVFFFRFRFWRRQLHAIGLPIAAWANLLPSCRSAFKVAESLGQLERLNNDAFFLLVIADLCVTSKGKVFAQWMAIETVVSHDATQIRVANKEDTEEIVDLTLIPVGAIVEVRNGGDRCRFIGICFNAQASIVPHREQVVDDFKALIARWIINGSDVGHLGKLGGGVVLQESKYWRHGGGGDVNCELILPY